MIETFHSDANTDHENCIENVCFLNLEKIIKFISKMITKLQKNETENGQMNRTERNGNKGTPKLIS